MSPSPQKEEAKEQGLKAKLRTLEAEVVSAGLPPSKFMPVFRKGLLSTPDPERALNNVLRFIASGFTSSLLRDFSDSPVLLNIALTLFSHSQYLADILVRSPELFHWLTATSALLQARTREDYFGDALSAIAPFERTEGKLDALKRFQRREILKISTKDILKEADLPAITRELSWLADSIVSAVVKVGIEDLNRRLGSDILSTFCVVGLGKLGGTELNFSSDIDLMFVYDAEGDLDFELERIRSFHEYYCRLAEFVVRRLSEHTNEGHLYRIDMRLRPDGAVGPLAMSREGYLRYYETRGELWERQMLLKARIIAGNEEVGQHFLNDLRPFVYPSTVLHDPREEILAIKNRIEAGLQGKTNVKLSRGGIRDIEFVVQALQMLHSHAEADLKEPNTLEAIEKLHRALLITRTEARDLRLGYRFLRHVEHRLQLLHGTQTHELPVNKEELRLLGRRLGFKSTTAFEQELTRVQGQIRKIYDSVFLEERTERERDGASRSIPKMDTNRLIARHGFLNARQALAAIDDIRKNLVQLNDPVALRRILATLQSAGAPDSGLVNFRILASSQPLVRTFDQVLANKRMLDLLLTVCSRSRRLTHLMAHEPLLFESVLGRTEDIFKTDIEWKFLLENDPLRFRSFNEGKTIIQWLMGALTIDEAARAFSIIADTVVRNIAEALSAGFPVFAEDVCIIALGKFGGEEILIGSDLDLLILTRNSGQQNLEQPLDKAAVEFIRAFATESGQVYHVDLRLRPEGKSAPVTAELSYYRQYLEERADLWEKQALLKARIVHGGKGLRKEFETLRKNVLIQATRESNWPDKIWEMKTKMERERTDEKSRNKDLKVGKGGLIDLEFLIQAVQLKYFPSENSMGSVNSFDAIDRIGKLGVLTKRVFTLLKRNYTFLRELELLIRMNSESNQFVLMDEKTLLQTVAAGVGERSAKSLKARIGRVRKENRDLMKQAFAALRR